MMDAAHLRSADGGRAAVSRTHWVNTRREKERWPKITSLDTPSAGPTMAAENPSFALASIPLHASPHRRPRPYRARMLDAAPLSAPVPASCFRRSTASRISANRSPKGVSVYSTRGGTSA